jgi:CHRD domain
MKHLRISALAATMALLSVIGVLALAVPDGDRSRSLRADLRGIEEVPSVVTAARGEFKATISSDESSFEYELSYENLQGTITQAHIHIAQKSVNGGISVWLCGTEAIPGPAGTPRCPASGTITGTITAANVVGPAGQGVAATEFEDLLRAIRSGVTYANVHSSLAPGGEIRGQVRAGRHGHYDRHDHHDHD